MKRWNRRNAAGLGMLLAAAALVLWQVFQAHTNVYVMVYACGGLFVGFALMADWIVARVDRWLRPPPYDWHRDGFR